MRRLIASRKLKRTCYHCNKQFKKNEIYYKRRVVETNGFIFDLYINSYEYLVCPRCKYKNEQQKKRFKAFKWKCIHSEKFIETLWDYIPGECVKEPQYDYCTLCGEVLN